MHHAAPKRMFSAPVCVLWAPSSDPRTPDGCALQYPYAKPDGRPLPPPMRVVTEGRNCERLRPAERACCGTFHGSPHRATCAKYRGKFKVQNA